MKPRERRRKMQKYYFLMGEILAYPKCCTHAFVLNYRFNGEDSYESHQSIFTCSKHRHLSDFEVWKLIGRDEYDDNYVRHLSNLCRLYVSLITFVEFNRREKEIKCQN